MKKLCQLLVLSVCITCAPGVSVAGYAEGNPFSAGNTNTTPAPDAYGMVVRCASGCSGGAGGGTASLDEQQTQTGILTTIDAVLDTIYTYISTTLAGYLDGLEALLTTIDADTGSIATGVGAPSDAASTAGGEGSIAAQLRRLTTDIDAIKTAVQLLDDAIDGTKTKTMLVDSIGNEIVVPTAGLTSYTAAAASTNSTNVLNAAGTVYHYSLTNTTATVYYLRMYNSASAPTCSSATGFVETIPIPASTSGGGRERIMNIGQAFTTGISFCITGGASSTDNTNAATGVYVTLLYKEN